MKQIRGKRVAVAAVVMAGSCVLAVNASLWGLRLLGVTGAVMGAFTLGATAAFASELRARR